MIRSDKLKTSLLTSLLFVVLTAECFAQPSSDRVLRLVDSNLEPVIDAKVMVFDGRFGKLIKSEEGTWRIKDDVLFVIAKADQFQFSGVLLSKDSGPDLKIMLRPLHEPGQDFRTLPVPIELEQRENLRESLLNRLTQRLAIAEDEQSRVKILQVISRHDPEFGSRLLHESDFEFSTRSEATIQQEAVRSWAKTDPIRALEIIRETDHDYMQALMLQALLEHLPAHSPYRESCQAQALRKAEAISQPHLRFAGLAILAELIDRLGNQEVAKRITNANIASAEELPSEGWSIYSRSLFAALIVNDDPDRAVKMIEESDRSLVPDKPEIQRAWARLAFACCHEHPELAKQLLVRMREVDPESSQLGYATIVIQRMAVKHPDIAIEAVKEIEGPVYQARVMGLIASRCHTGFPDLSREVLLRTAAELFDNAEELQASRTQGTFHPAPIVVGLLPICERVAPDQLESMIWQTLWMSVPRSRFSIYPTSNSEVIQHAAAGVSRYDTVLGETLWGERELVLSREGDRDVDSCLALNPKDLFSFLEKAERDDAYGFATVIGSALDLLAANDDAFWDEVSRPGLWVWVGETDVFK